MLIKNNKSTFFITKNKDITNIPILFIHGFTGSSESWKTIRNNIDSPSLAIDIPGHNKSYFHTLEDEYYFNDFSNELYISLAKLEINKLHICGYSLGGRLALAFSSKYPDMIESLILESTSLGIENKDERDLRYAKDLNLSSSIKENLTEFVDNWESGKLFLSQKSRNLKEFNNQRDIRLRHNINQLSNSLKMFSVGNMPYMLYQYQKLKFPLFIINGEEDHEYIKHGKEMLRLNKNTKQYIVSDASHNTHLENTDSFCDIINNILTIKGVT